MRIPKMDVQVARDLIDIGINELYELEGRAAESLFDEIKKIRPDTPLYRMSHIRMAIYFSENDDPDPKSYTHLNGRNNWMSKGLFLIFLAS